MSEAIHRDDEEEGQTWLTAGCEELDWFLVPRRSSNIKVFQLYAYAVTCLT
jgi:hypothetical protein